MSMLLIEAMVRERTASLHREAERYRMLREASIPSLQHAARSPGRDARVRRGRRLTRVGAVARARVDVAVEGLCGGGLPAVTFWDSAAAMPPARSARLGNCVSSAWDEAAT
jgi:hypothetical protein